MSEGSEKKASREPSSAEKSSLEENSPEKSSEEKRIHPRAGIELQVDYKRVNSFLADYTKNISRGGTFIGTDKPLPIGTRFHFKISLPGMREPFTLTGEVAWIAPAGPAAETAPGMGIRFVYADELGRATFESEVERLMEKHFGPELSAKLLGKKAR